MASGWIVRTDRAGILVHVSERLEGAVGAAVSAYRAKLTADGWTIEPSRYADSFFCSCGGERHLVGVSTYPPGRVGERLATPKGHSTPDPRPAPAEPVALVVHITCKHCGHVARVALDDIPKGKPETVAARLRCRVCGQRGAAVELKRYKGPGALVLRFPGPP